MVKTKVAEIEGKELFYCQLTSQDEAKKNNLPDGIYFFWEYGGERIQSPWKVVSMIQHACYDGKLQVNKMITPPEIRKHYSSLMQAQQEQLLTALNKTKEIYVKNGMPKQTLDVVDQMIETYSGKEMPCPNIHGRFKPTRRQAERLVGKETLEKYLNKEQIKESFGEE